MIYFDNAFIVPRLLFSSSRADMSFVDYKALLVRFFVYEGDFCLVGRCSKKN